MPKSNNKRLPKRKNVFDIHESPFTVQVTKEADKKIGGVLQGRPHKSQCHAEQSEFHADGVINRRTTGDYDGTVPVGGDGEDVDAAQDTKRHKRNQEQKQRNELSAHKRKEYDRLRTGIALRRAIEMFEELNAQHEKDEDAEEERNRQRKKLDDALNACNAMRKEIADLIEQRDKAINECSAMEKEKAELIKQLDEADNACNEMRKEKGALRKQIDEALKAPVPPRTQYSHFTERRPTTEACPTNREQLEKPEECEAGSHNSGEPKPETDNGSECNEVSQGYPLSSPLCPYRHDFCSLFETLENKEHELMLQVEQIIDSLTQQHSSDAYGLDSVNCCDTGSGDASLHGLLASDVSGKANSLLEESPTSVKLTAANDPVVPGIDSHHGGGL